MLERLLEACAKSNLEEIKKIADAIPVSDKFSYMTTCLLKTINRNPGKNQIKVIKFLLDLGASTNENSANGNTILHTAVQANNIEIVKCLLEHNVPVDAKNAEGLTPIQLFAKKTFKIEIAELLIAHGADIHNNFKVQKHGVPHNLLHYVAKDGNKELADLLIKNNVNANILEKYFLNVRPIDYAIEAADIDMVLLLLKCDATIDNHSYIGTPIKLAIKSNNRNLIEIILTESLKYSHSVKKYNLNAVANSNYSDIVYLVLKAEIKQRLTLLTELQFKIISPEDNFAELFSKLGLSNDHHDIHDVIRRSLKFINDCNKILVRNNEPAHKNSFTLFHHTFYFGRSNAKTNSATIAHINSLIMPSNIKPGKKIVNELQPLKQIQPHDEFSNSARKPR